MSLAAVTLAGTIAASALGALAPWVGLPRVSTEDLLRWNALTGVVPTAAWPQVDAALDDYRREAIVIGDAADLPDLSRTNLRNSRWRAETPEALQALQNRLANRVDRLVAEEARLGATLLEILGEERRGEIELLLTQRALELVPGTHPLQLKLPDLSALELSDDARAAAQVAIAGAVPRLRSMAIDLARSMARSAALAAVPPAADGQATDAVRDAWRSLGRERMRLWNEALAELAKLRRAVVLVLPPDQQDQATMVLFGQIMMDRWMSRAVDRARTVVPRLRDLDEAQRATLQAEMERTLEAMREARSEMAKAMESRLRSGGGWDYSLYDELQNRMRAPALAAQVRLGAVLGADRLMRIATLVVADEDSANRSTLAELVGEDQVEEVLREVDPRTAEIWAGGATDAERSPTLGWSDLTAVRPLAAGDLRPLRALDEAALLAAFARHEATWNALVAPLQTEVANALARQREPADAIDFDAEAATLHDLYRRLEEAVRQTDDALFAALAEMQHLASDTLAELRARRVAAVYGAPSESQSWARPHGRQLPLVVDVFSVLDAAGLDAGQRAVARSVALGHVEALETEARRRHRVLAQVAAMQETRQAALKQLTARMRGASPEGHAALAAEMQEMRRVGDAAVARLRPAEVQAEAQWAAAIAALREDWSAALDPTAMARLGSAYRALAYPRMMHDPDRLDAALAEAADLLGDDARAEAIRVLAADHAARYEALSAAWMETLEATPLEGWDGADAERGDHPQRRRLVAELLAERRELNVRTARDASLLLGPELTVRLPRLRRIIWSASGKEA